MESRKLVLIAIFMSIFWGTVFAQLDPRFGVGGVAGTQHLGEIGAEWYRDWNNSYLPENMPQADKQKILTVGKLNYRTDNLGMDWKWYILDLLDRTDVDFLQNLFNLSLAIVNKNVIPTIGDYWNENREPLEDTLADTLDSFVYTDVKYRIKYKADFRDTRIDFQDELPEFNITVGDDIIRFNTSLSADWHTVLIIQAWVLNPNPFRWGYHWKKVGEADARFTTTISINGEIGLNGTGRERNLQVSVITPDSRTQSHIDWDLLGISFTWNELSNSVENMIDTEIENSIGKELDNDDLKKPYYFVDYFKSLFPNEEVPTQQEILDRIYTAEQSHIARIISDEGRVGQYWTVGYEPNWIPMFDPTVYAAQYTRYYELIKGFDPTAKFVGPSLFLTEAIDQPIEVLFKMVPQFFLGLLEPLKEDLKGVLDAYLKKGNCVDWYNTFLNSLPPDVKVDINDFHIFPMSAETRSVNWENVRELLEDNAICMRELSGVNDVWITGFGNMDWNRSEAEVTEMCRQFCEYLKTNPVGITRWFWYISSGHDPLFDEPMTPKAPFTALLRDDFSLTQIGQAYLAAADITPPIISTAPIDIGEVSNSLDVTFTWEAAREHDTGISGYQLQIGTAPGDSSIYNAWLGNVTSAVITGENAQTFYARIRAKNGAGLVSAWSPWSDGITIDHGLNVIHPEYFQRDSEGSLVIKVLYNNEPVANAHVKVDGSGIIIPREELTNEQGICSLLIFTNRSGTINVTVEKDPYPIYHGEIIVGNPAEFDEKKTSDNQNELTTINLPQEYAISQNYPNPFNPETTISYQLPEASDVKLVIYNTVGQQIKTVVSGQQAAGFYNIQWDGRDETGQPVVSGIYVYRIKAGKFVATRKMTLLR